LHEASIPLWQRYKWVQNAGSRSDKLRVKSAFSTIYASLKAPTVGATMKNLHRIKLSFNLFCHLMTETIGSAGVKNRGIAE